MNTLIKVMHIVVFVFASFVVASICYEGLTLTWYSFVPILMLVTDMLFMIATTLNLVYFRKNKMMVFINLFSTALIAIALIMKVLNIEYPKWSLLFWDFYILYLYGFLVIRKKHG